MHRLLSSTVARSPASIKRIKLSLESVLHLPSGHVWNVTLTLLSSLDTLSRALSASTMSRLDSTLSRNSTLPTPTDTYSLRYFVLLDASPSSETYLIRAITTAATSGNLTSVIRKSDPSFSGISLSGTPSFTVLSYTPQNTSPTLSDKSTQIPLLIWVVVCPIVGLLMLCCALFAYYSCRSTSSTTIYST
jgi:hypothetical protein